MARPSFKPTPTQRRQVSIAAGAGMSHEEIAIALGIARNTLEKHFTTELSVGALQRRMEVLNAMHVAAKKGNVAAQKAYMAMTPIPVAPPVPEGDAQPAEKPAAKRVGKKEQAQIDATTAAQGTGWEDLLGRGGRPPLQ